MALLPANDAELLKIHRDHFALLWYFVEREGGRFEITREEQEAYNSKPHDKEESLAIRFEPNGSVVVFIDDTPGLRNGVSYVLEEDLNAEKISEPEKT